MTQDYEVWTLRRRLDALEAGREEDRLAFANTLQTIEDQVGQLRRELADERRLNAPMRGRVNSLETWAS